MSLGRVEDSLVVDADPAASAQRGLALSARRRLAGLDLRRVIVIIIVIIIIIIGTTNSFKTGAPGGPRLLSLDFNCTQHSTGETYSRALNLNLGGTYRNKVSGSLVLRAARAGIRGTLADQAWSDGCRVANLQTWKRCLIMESTGLREGN